MSKSIVRSIKNVANGYSSVQILVRNATSNDASGPTTYDMEEIASYTYRSQTDYLEIMDMLDRRLNDKGKNWRHVAKSLTVLDYLVRYGSDKCVLWSKDNLYIIKTLREFVHFDEQSNDQGAIIRVKAKELVSLLNDDERLRHERELAARSNGRHRRDRDRDRNRERRSRRNTIRSDFGGEGEDGDEEEDDDLQRALEISKITAEEEARLHQQENSDPDLRAALKLSMEEEEMRRERQAQNDNLLDLNDENPQFQPQYYMSTGYVQQPQYYVVPQQTQQPQGQYDLFGNPVQNPMATGYYQQQYFSQQPTQQPQFTGFHVNQQKNNTALQPLKTGSNNPFALRDESNGHEQPQKSSLKELASQHQNQQSTIFEAPTQRIRPQTTSSSKFGDASHPELNNILMQAPGIDTFGNTGETRIPHQHTKTQTFINSNGTGYRQSTGDVRVSSNATGNPFLSTGIGYQQTPMYAAPTGFGFGNGNQNNQQRKTDGPSLIDI